MMTVSNPMLRRTALALCVTFTLGCVARQNLLASWQQPSEITREWVDVDKSTPDDTTLWVLGAGGYDGIAHLQRSADSSGIPRQVRNETRYGYWHFQGTLGDSAHQAICFSPRSGRIGATCTAFVMDTVLHGMHPTPRLILRAYHGNHHTRDRVLMARATAMRP